MVIRPAEKLPIGRIEKDPATLRLVYQIAAAWQNREYQRCFSFYPEKIKTSQYERTYCDKLRQVLPSAALGSAQEHMNHTIAQLCIGLITHRKIHPGLFIHNALVVREGIKTDYSMICTHAAFSHAAESHVGGCKMNDTIIDTATAKAAAGGDSSDYLLSSAYTYRARGVSWLFTV